MVELADIFRRYGPAYRQKNAQQMLPGQLRAMWAIENCRTETLGGHLYRCPNCDEVVYSYHSCRNRHCNLCQGDKVQAWLERQMDLLLPAPYFLITFTLPSELRRLAYGNQKVVYDLLFRAAAEALTELAADPRFVGAQIGMLGVLHTWTRDLRFHPHVHFLVPGGGLDFTRERWQRARNTFFVRVEPLAILFQAKFRTGLKKAGLYARAPAAAWRGRWVVHCQPAGHGVKAMEYLADYLFRVAIGNHRIVKLEDGRVTFWYKESRSGKRRTCTLAVDEFMRRFLQHVLPKGFVIVRYYGFYAPGNRARLQLARELLLDAVRKPKRLRQQTAPLTASVQVSSHTRCCPRCRQTLTVVQTLRPRSRCPPPF